jgi:DNA mismatch repair protein MutS
MALVNDYFEKTKEYKREYGYKTLVFMQVGSFFEVYGLIDKNTGLISGSNITEFSQICDLNIGEKNVTICDKSVLMAGFTLSFIDKYLKKMNDSNYTVVVYKQDNQFDPNDKSKVVTRSLDGIYSPGTYFSLESTKITNNTICIWINTIDMNSSLLSKYISQEKYKSNKMIYVGIANIDIYTGSSSIFEFQENYINNPTTFDELERFISIYNPSEAIIVGNISEEEMKIVINYANIRCNSIHLISTLIKDESSKILKQAFNCERQIYQKEVLYKFFPDKYIDSNHLSEFYQKVYATQAFCFLLDFIYQHNPNLVNKIGLPIFENCSNRLVLANHSLKQLNIIHDDNEYSGKFSSVEKMLNYCVTPMGKRKFSHLFLNPTTNEEYLQSEYDIVTHILTDYPTNEIDNLKIKMSMIKDISKINRLLIMKKITPKTLSQIYKNLITIKEIYLDLERDKILLQYVEKFNIKSVSLHCQTIIDFLEKTLDINLCESIDTTQKFEINFINSGINAELDINTKLLNDSVSILEAIRVFFNNCIGQNEKKQSEFVKLHETEKNNFTLLATQTRCKRLKDFMKTAGPENSVDLKYGNDDKIYPLKFSKYAITFSQKTSSDELITSGQILDLCNNITTVKQGLKDIIASVYLDILNKLEMYQEEIETAIDFVTVIDVVFSKAFIARKFNYCKPEIMSSELCSNKSFVEAYGLRHCLIENIQQTEIYVTNDITLGKCNKGKCTECTKDGMLLYGTNAVGKTSFIRALGISVIMAQAGLFVPCSKFVYYPYKYIFTRIIGNDNIFKGLSTFAVEMSELRTILRLADSNSLILGDELCSGTESISAQSIFVAGIQQLCKKRSSFIFATHLHEIVNYDEIKEISNQVSLNHMAVIYDKENDVLLYDRKLKDGAGTNMYGLEVCRSLNLPDEFLKMAHDIRMKYHPESASILSLNTSHFNSKKVVGKCELCNETMGTEVHHLQHQNKADENGIIRSSDGSIFHKNHPANLMTLCDVCHKKIHETGEQHKKVKTTKGRKVKSIA